MKPETAGDWPYILPTRELEEFDKWLTRAQLSCATWNILVGSGDE